MTSRRGEIPNQEELACRIVKSNQLLTSDEALERKLRDSFVLYPASSGAKVLRGARQSIPSSNIESWAGDSVTTPALVVGQMKRPLSSRFANRHKPWPSR